LVVWWAHQNKKQSSFFTLKSFFPNLCILLLYVFTFFTQLFNILVELTKMLLFLTFLHLAL
jgi:hypothetical protein